MSDVDAIKNLVNKHNALRQEIAKVIVGQDDVIEEVLLSIFCKGHSLLVGVPGLAKTLLVNTVADVLGLSFNRIQFTPDLMPSDIVGSEILDESRHFKFVKGPLFANIILADEINRTPPKTQSALLEAMQEKSVTTAGHSYKMENPFFVLATQNPIEQEGTYPLPEAQLDRFMFNIKVEYPKYEEELMIVRNTTSDQNVQLNKVLDGSEIIAIQDLIRKIPVTDHVLEYDSISIERFTMELMKVAKAGGRAMGNFIELMSDYDLLDFYLPEIEACRYVYHYHMHHPEGSIMATNSQWTSGDDLLFMDTDVGQGHPWQGPLFQGDFREDAPFDLCAD